MDIREFQIKGPKVLIPRVWQDERGRFWECYRKPLYESLGIVEDFVQDNHSYSKKDTLRGMHFQSEPGQAKLISVLEGKIFDVFVDIRPESRTFGKWESVLLDDCHHHQLYLPIGFAHGFCVLSDRAHVIYKVSSLYHPDTEKGFQFNDPEIGIEWPIQDPLLSERDRRSGRFCEVVK